MKNEIDLFIEAKVLPEYQSIVSKFRELIQNEYPEIKEQMRGGVI